MSESVLITGAGTGIGLATALYLAQQGYQVYATVPDLKQQADIEQAADLHNVRLRTLQLDVTDQQSIQAALDRVIDESGSLYAVVNNAGLGLRGFFEDLAAEELERLFDVNVYGVFNVTRAALPYMRRAQRGRIVIISSVGGRIATMSLSGYCASKFALEGFAESLAQEILPFGLHVSLIEPGLVMTPHFTTNRGRAQAATNPDSPYYEWFARHEQLVDRILRANRIAPADVAKAIEKALSAKRPRLRYVVGRGAKLAVALRRYLPNQLFERFYFGQVIRIVSGSRQQVEALSQLSLPGGTPVDYLGLDRAISSEKRDG